MSKSASATQFRVFFFFSDLGFRSITYKDRHGLSHYVEYCLDEAIVFWGHLLQHPPMS